MQDFFIHDLVSTIKCVVCGHGYDKSNVKVLGRRETLWFLSVYCPSCHSQGLVAAIVEENQKMEVMRGELEAEFDGRGQDGPVAREAITFDDVLGIHRFLEGFDGDFSRLFLEGEERRQSI